MGRRRGSHRQISGRWDREIAYISTLPYKVYTAIFERCTFIAFSAISVVYKRKNCHEKENRNGVECLTYCKFSVLVGVVLYSDRECRGCCPTGLIALQRIQEDFSIEQMRRYDESKHLRETGNKGEKRDYVRNSSSAGSSAGGYARRAGREFCALF